MEHESKSKVVIIGGGPAGCFCAYFLQDKFDVTIIDKKSPLATLLPTGGGRCNFAHSEYDFKELAKNYPRGEKFLYSVFSEFSTADTVDFFEKIGVKSYTQDDNRIFPISNSSKDVRNKLLASLGEVKFLNEEALRVNKNSENFDVVTDMGLYRADYVIIAIGGHSSFELVRMLGHNVIDLKPSLTALKTKEDFSKLSGVSIDGVLFTHQGISGPYVYELSSIHARDILPYKLNFNFKNFDNLQELLNLNPHKSIKNLLGEYMPKSFALHILDNLGIDLDLKCHNVTGKIRDMITDKLEHFEITVIGTVPDGEVVMSGGVDLKEINPKTMESKIVKNIYFCGEVLDIDGFCGGFNLQNCWSTGYVVAKNISKFLFT